MEICKIITPSSFDEFYMWLYANHAREKEVLVEVKKGRPADGSLSYVDAVYAALCFGWIDSVCRNINGKTVQRFSPRQKKSPWTELNKERCKWLEKHGKRLMRGAVRLQIAWRSLKFLHACRKLLAAMTYCGGIFTHFQRFISACELTASSGIFHTKIGARCTNDRLKTSSNKPALARCMAI